MLKLCRQGIFEDGVHEAEANTTDAIHGTKEVKVAGDCTELKLTLKHSADACLRHGPQPGPDQDGELQGRCQGWQQTTAADNYVPRMTPACWPPPS